MQSIRVPEWSSFKSQARRDADCGVSSSGCFPPAIYASEEALAILAYPEVPSRDKDFGNSLQSKIRSLLHNNGNHNGHHNGFSPSNFYTKSPRERGATTARILGEIESGNVRGPAIALLLERITEARSISKASLRNSG